MSAPRRSIVPVLLVRNADRMSELMNGNVLYAICTLSSTVLEVSLKDEIQLHASRFVPQVFPESLYVRMNVTNEDS